MFWTIHLKFRWETLTCVSSPPSPKLQPTTTSGCCQGERWLIFKTQSILYRKELTTIDVYLGNWWRVLRKHSFSILPAVKKKMEIEMLFDVVSSLDWLGFSLQIIKLLGHILVVKKKIPQINTKWICPLKIMISDFFTYFIYLFFFPRQGFSV